MLDLETAEGCGYFGGREAATENDRNMGGTGNTLFKYSFNVSRCAASTNLGVCDNEGARCLMCERMFLFHHSLADCTAQLLAFMPQDRAIAPPGSNAARTKSSSVELERDIDGSGNMDSVLVVTWVNCQESEGS